MFATHRAALCALFVSAAIPLPACAQEPRDPTLEVAAAPDPFAGTFRGDGLELQLERAERGYRGTLRQGQASHPVAARVRASGILAGTFTAGGERFALECQRTGATLVLRTDEREFTLRAEPVAAGAAAQAGNPLGPLHAGPTRPWTHPSGRFRLALPEDWTVARNSEGATVFNPGLRESDTLDAWIVLTAGELDAAERGKNAGELFAAGQDELIAGMAQQGITIERTRQQPRAVRVGRLAGAEQTWRGRTDQRQVSVWLGGVVAGHEYVAITAVIVEGAHERFLQGPRGMLHSLEPLDAASGELAGEFAGSITMSGGSLTTIYTFAANGTVRRQILASGTVGFGGEVGADAGDRGTWTAAGAALTLTIDGDQTAATLVREGGRVVAIRIGQRVYRRQR